MSILRVGLFSDVHANIAALDALLAEFELRGVDELWCAGDLVGIGPRPVECVRRIMELKNLIVVMGNHEKYHLTRGHERADFSVAGRKPMPDEVSHHAWRWRTVVSDPTAHEWLATLPYSVTLERCGFTATIVHYAPSGNKSWARFPTSANAASVDALFRAGGVDADIVLYGHEHNPSFMMVGGTTYMAPGSAGCACTGPGKPRRGTRGAVLTISEHGFSYEPFEVDYNVDSVRADMQNIPDGLRLGLRFM